MICQKIAHLQGLDIQWKIYWKSVQSQCLNLRQLNQISSCTSAKGFKPALKHHVYEGGEGLKE